MSLLNEMLRELHRRDVLPTEAPTGVMAGVTVTGQTDTDPRSGLPRKQSPGFPWRRGLLLVAALAMTAAGYALSHSFRTDAIASSEGLQQAPVVQQEGAIEGLSMGSTVLLETSLSPNVSLRMGTSLMSASLGGLEKTTGPAEPRARSGDFSGATAPARVADVRVIQSSREAVAVMELDQPVEYRIFILADPTRLVLEIPQAMGPIPMATVEGRGPVERVRMAPDAAEGLRMVLDLSRPVSIRHSSVEPKSEQSHLLRIELVSAQEERNMAKAIQPEEVLPASSVPMAVQADQASDEHAAAGTMEKKPVQVHSTDVAESHYRKAMQLFKTGRDRAGEVRLRKALAVDPGHAAARETLVLRLYAQRRLRDATEVSLDGLRLQPGNSRLNNLYARLLAERGEPKEALGVLSNLSPPLAEDPDYHAFRAALLQKTRQYSKAAELYRRLLVVRPKAGIWWMGLAIALESSGDTEQALQAYRKAAGQVDMTVTLNRFVKDRIQQIESQRS